MVHRSGALPAGAPARARAGAGAAQAHRLRRRAHARRAGAAHLRGGDPRRRRPRPRGDGRARRRHPRLLGRARHPVLAGRCGCRPSSPPSTLLDLGARIVLRHGSHREAVEALRRAGGADLGVARVWFTRGDVDGLARRKWPRDELAASPTASSTRRSPTSRPLRELSARPLILAERGTALRETVMAACQEAGFSPVPPFEVGDPATARFLAHAGLGASVVPGLVAGCAGAGGLGRAPGARAAAAAVPARARRRAHARRPAAARAALRGARLDESSAPGRRSGASSGATRRSARRARRRGRP